MDFFPLLKKGLTTKNIVHKVSTAYGLIKCFIDREDLNNPSLLSKIYSDHFLSYEGTVFKAIIIDINIDDNVLRESMLADSLLATINLVGRDDNNLLSLINNVNPKVIISKILNESFKIPSIRLLSNVIYDNTEDMTIALYVDEIDFYDGYIDLYNLAIEYKHNKIANMIKDVTIIKNFYIKEALKVSFENLIGPSNIPNLIYDLIIK
jgi:hypothetical protein